MDDDSQIISIPFEVDELDEMPQEYRTYKIDFSSKRIAGKTEGLEAVAQAAWKAMQTRRFAHLLYDDQYGNDLFNKVSESDLTDAYLQSEVPKMIEDALMVDERITEVSNIQYEVVSHDSVHISAYVASIYGDFEMEGVIDDVS